MKINEIEMFNTRKNEDKKKKKKLQKEREIKVTKKIRRYKNSLSQSYLHILFNSNL